VKDHQALFSKDVKGSGLSLDSPNIDEAFSIGFFDNEGHARAAEVSSGEARVG
jgi:hypothetical protein